MSSAKQATNPTDANKSSEIRCLPDFIIEEILTVSEFHFQVKYQRVSKDFHRKLIPQIYESMEEDDLLDINTCKLNSWVPKYGKYVKKMDTYVDEDFSRIIHYFPNLKHLGFEVRGGESISKESASGLKLTSVEIYSYKLTNPQLLIEINQIFPNLKVLYLRSTSYFPGILERTNFPNLVKLGIISTGPQIFNEIPFKSFPKMKSLILEEISLMPVGEFNFSKFNKSNFNSLESLRLKIFFLPNEFPMLFDCLKFLDVHVRGEIKGGSLEQIFGLPALHHIVLKGKISDSGFQNVKCSGPLRKLETLGDLKLARNFLKFLQNQAPQLTNLTVKQQESQNIVIQSAFNSVALHDDNIKCSTKLQFVTVNHLENEFVNWVKRQSPQAFVTFGLSTSHYIR